MKITLMSIAVAAAALMTTACSGNTEQRTERSLAEKISACENPDSLRAYVNDAKDYAQTLISEGKYAEASAFIDSISPVVKDKAPALMGTFVALKGKVAADEAAEEVKDALQEGADKASEAADKVKDGVEEAAGKATDKAKEVAGKVADKAGDAVNKAADKASDAVDKATDKASDALNKAADKLKKK